MDIDLVVSYVSCDINRSTRFITF